MRPPPPVSGRDRRLLDVLSMGGVAIEDVARALGWKMVAVRQRLSVLRARGVARATALWSPEQAGWPVCIVTDVSLRPLTPAAMKAFEAWCLGEPCVTRADLVAGRYDYLLWSWHAGLREANAWSNELSARPDVRVAVSQPIRIRSGHNLSGAPVFTGAEA